MMGAIGIKLANGQFYPIMDEGLTVKKRLILTTVHDYQKSVQIDLYKSQNNSMTGALYIGTLVVENLPSRAKGGPSIELVIESTKDGVINAESFNMADIGGEHQHLSLHLKSFEEDKVDYSDFDGEADVKGIPVGEAAPVVVKEDAPEEAETDEFPVFSGLPEEPEGPAEESDGAEEPDGPAEAPGGLYEAAKEYEEESEGGNFRIILVGLIFVLLLLGGALWFFFFRDGASGLPRGAGNAPSSAVEETQPPAQAQPPAPLPPPEEAPPPEDVLPESVTPESAPPPPLEPPPEDAPPQEPPPLALPPAPQEPPPVIDTPPEPQSPPPSRKRPPAPVYSYKVPEAIPPEGIPYRIRWGDTLWDITEAFYRNPWLYRRIARYNDLRNPDLIVSGTEITIPPRDR